MKLELELYREQAKRWPAQGRHILAQFDDRSILVYQAYRPAIGRFAVQHGYFGGAFSYERMSWIKPNFLWMMYYPGMKSAQTDLGANQPRLPKTEAAHVHPVTGRPPVVR